jgi:hypothetical protein
VVLYEYATGVHPFAAGAALATFGRIMEREPAALSRVRPDVPREFAAAVARALCKEREERFATAAEFREALVTDAYLTQSSTPSATWWIIHMVSVLALYFVAAFVGWLVKEWDRGLGQTGFLQLATAAAAGGLLRSHLLFARRAHSETMFLRELDRYALALMVTDLAIGATLVVEGIWAADERPVPGALVLALGLGIAVARLVLERATTEAAFPRPADDPAPQGSGTLDAGHQGPEGGSPISNAGNPKPKAGAL